MTGECAEERILFTEDLIMYFMKKYNVEWKFAVHCESWDKYPRRFTEAMGSIARHLALTKTDSVKCLDDSSPFCLEKNFLFKPISSNCYNLEDFFHYCGVMAINLIPYCKKGKFKYTYRVLLIIFFYLGEIIRHGSGGWSELSAYADATLREINSKSLEERILFAEDMISYFMERSQVRWTSGSYGHVLDKNRQKFAEVIGSAAWWLEKSPLPPDRIIKHENGIIITTAYHPKDVLQYCGIVAMSSVWQFVTGNPEYPDKGIHDIVSYLGAIQEEDTFHVSGGWDDILHFARLYRVNLMRGQIPYTMQNWQTNISQEMQEEDEADGALMEEQCIGTLLQNL